MHLYKNKKFLALLIIIPILIVIPVVFYFISRTSVHFRDESRVYNIEFHETQVLDDTLKKIKFWDNNTIVQRVDKPVNKLKKLEIVITDKKLSKYSMIDSDGFTAWTGESAVDYDTLTIYINPSPELRSKFGSDYKDATQKIILYALLSILYRSSAVYEEDDIVSNFAIKDVNGIFAVDQQNPFRVL